MNDKLKQAYQLLSRAATKLQDYRSDQDDDSNDPLAMEIYEFIEQEVKNNDQEVFVKEIYSWDSGGNITLTVIELNNKMTIIITDECITIYKNMTAFTNNEKPLSIAIIDSPR